jgi:hypothetical protein
MIGNIICWIIAIALIMSKSFGDILYTKLLYAMGFILLGILSKFVDYYREVHKDKSEKKDNILNT